MFLFFVAACGKGSATGSPAPSASVATVQGGSASGAAASEPDAATWMDARATELWARAKDGAAEDLARLADHESSAGLVERGEDPTKRMTAIRALAFAHDFAGLPWLAEIAASGSDEEARAALESATDLAARPRRAVDPDDAEELKAGADKLLALAKDTSAARERRIGAIRILRMLVDRHVVSAKDIPTEFDR